VTVNIPRVECSRIADSSFAWAGLDEGAGWSSATGLDGGAGGSCATGLDRRAGESTAGSDGWAECDAGGLWVTIADSDWGVWGTWDGSSTRIILSYFDYVMLM